MTKQDIAQDRGKSKPRKPQAAPRDSDLWYERYPRRFREATQTMPFDLRGAYALLIDLYFEFGKPLPNDDKWVACALYIDVRKWKPIRKALFDAGKLTLGKDGCIHNELADQLLSARRDRVTASRPVDNFAMSPSTYASTSLGTEGDNSKFDNEINGRADTLTGYKGKEDSPSVPLGASTKKEAPPDSGPSGTDGGWWLPFSSETLDEVVALEGIDVEGLIQRYNRAAARKPIADPSAYLLKMAHNTVAKARGISAEQLRRILSRNTKERVTEMANVVGAFSRPSAALLASHTRSNPQRTERAVGMMAGKTFTSQALADKAFESYAGFAHFGRVA